MASREESKKAQEQQLQQILDSGNKTLALLQVRAEIPASFDTDLAAAVTSLFRLQPITLLAETVCRLDKLGSSLWNTAATLSCHDGISLDPASCHSRPERLVVLLRVYAYLLVDTAHRSFSRRRKATDHQVRILRVALKACRTCLDHSELQLAYNVLQRLADQVGRVESASSVINVTEQHGDALQHVLRIMGVEYHLLRMAHAWKSDRPDLVDHFYTQLDSTCLAGNADLSEKAAELFHEMAKSILVKKLYHDAVKWSERSLEILNACDVVDLGPNTPDLRLATTSTLVNSFLGMNNPECRSKAVLLVEQLDSVHGLGNRVAMHLMRFNLLINDPATNCQLIEETMSRMIAMTVLTEKGFKLLLHILHKAQQMQMSCTLSALHDLIVKRLLPDLDSEVSLDSSPWIRVEKAAVTYVMFATADSKKSNSETMSSLKLLLDSIQHHCQQPFSTQATHAAQTLMWKAMGSILESDAAAAHEWCLLLRHPIFANAGQINKARIWRKALHSAITCGDLQSAREVFFTMPIDVQNESLTRYLCFKLALRSEDAELAYECLDIVASGAQNDPSLLFACVLDAQQSDMRRLATVTLLKIVDHRPVQVHLPSLLRCAVRLLMGELEANGRDLDQVMVELLHVIDTAAANLKSLQQGTTEQSLAELQWWSKNTYNVAIQFCTAMNPEHLVRVLQACMKFSDSYTSNNISTNQQDSRRRKMLCRFLGASALIVLGRAETGNAENSLQYYLRARREITAFQSLASCSETDDAIDNEAMFVRAFELLKFDLEAILKLQQWDQLDAGLQSILKFPSSDCWESAIDLLFTIHDHATNQNVNPSLTTRIPDVLQKCTNESWKKDKDIHKMSRWLRLIFTLHLESSPSEATNLAFALKIVSQAATIAKRGYDGKNDPYPADELAWLATTAFNKAVDLLVLEDDVGADAWIAAALELARYADDEGRLHASLTANKTLADERRCGRTAAAAAGMLH